MPRSSSRPVYLRLALALVMERLNFTREKIAREIDIDFTPLNHFLDGRNKSKGILEIEEYLRNLVIDFDTEILFVFQKLFPDKYGQSNIDIQTLYPLAIRTFLEMDETHAVSNFDWYAGSYLGYRYAYDDEQVTVIWIQLFGPSKDLDIATYRAFQRSVGGDEFHGNGFVVSSRLNITLVGSKSAANIELARFNRVEQKVRFLHGIVLTENSHGYPLAARFYCDRISDDPNCDRKQYDNMITNMKTDEFLKGLKEIGKSKEDIAKILFHIDNAIPNHKNPYKNVLISSIEPSWRDYEKYKVD